MSQHERLPSKRQIHLLLALVVFVILFTWVANMSPRRSWGIKPLCNLTITRIFLATLTGIRYFCVTIPLTGILEIIPW